MVLSISICREIVFELQLEKTILPFLDEREANTINARVDTLMDDFRAAIAGTSYCFDDATLDNYRETSGTGNAYIASCIAHIDLEIAALEQEIRDEEARLEAERLAAEAAAAEKAS